MEGQKLVLVCLVAGGTGEVTFVWYKGALGLALETRTQRSLTAEFEVPAVKESDAELYYCAADNGRGPCLSGLVSVTVTGTAPCPWAHQQGPHGAMFPWPPRTSKAAEALWAEVTSLSPIGAPH